MSSPRPLTCVSPASAGGERTLSGVPWVACGSVCVCLPLQSAAPQGTNPAVSDPGHLHTGD